MATATGGVKAGYICIPSDVTAFFTTMINGKESQNTRLKIWSLVEDAVYIATGGRVLPEKNIYFCLGL